jgi:hypothetical protein
VASNKIKSSGRWKLMSTVEQEEETTRRECADLAALVVARCATEDLGRLKLALVHLMAQHCGGADNCVLFVPGWFFLDDKCWDRLNVLRQAQADARAIYAGMEATTSGSPYADNRIRAESPEEIRLLNDSRSRTLQSAKLILMPAARKK